MKLKELEFPPVVGQSGVQGFFGEGDEYHHHALFKLIPNFSFKGMGFVAKTTTITPKIFPETSNTELRDGYKVKRWFPNSVWWSPKSFFKGYLVNAVGLANPGTLAMLGYDKWQRRSDVFQLSFMALSGTSEGKVAEAEMYCDYLLKYMPPTSKHCYAIQVNESCPNTGHNQEQDPAGVIAVVEVFRRKLPTVPIIIKFDLLIEPKTIVALKPYCDAFCISNTVEVGKSNQFAWSELFDQGISPLLKHFGGKFKGGLSGAPLFPQLVAWLNKMQQYDSSVVIIAGGGIMTKENIRELSQFSIVHAVALGTVAILRPWRLQGLIRYAKNIFSLRKQQQTTSHERTHFA